jgi:hypothetical protein
LGCDETDPGVDRVAVPDDGRDQLAGQLGGRLVTLGLGEMALEDRFGRALPEVGLEDRGQRKSTTRSPAALLVSLRRHRR